MAYRSGTYVGAAGEIGGRSDGGPSFPHRGEPWRRCPITDLQISLSDAIWDGRRWVHPLAYDRKRPVRQTLRAPSLFGRRPLPPLPELGDL